MNDELMSSGAIDFKQLLLIKAKQLKIKDDECHLLLILMMMQDLKIKTINPQTIANYSSLSIKKIDTLLLSLLNKHYIERKNGLSLKPIYKTLLEIKVEKNQEMDLVDSFEDSFGRTLSSSELTIIESFKTSGYDDQMILDALNEAVKSNVFNFRYIEKILENWRLNGVKKRFARVPATTTNDVPQEVKEYKWWENE